MFRQAKKRLLSLSLLYALFFVVACGHSEQPTQPAHATVSPPSTAQVQRTPSQTGSVLITTDKSQYSTSDMITVTIIDNLSGTIYASPYYTECMPIQLQIKSAASWVALGRCPETTQGVLAIQPGNPIVYRLRPVAGSMGSQTGSGTTWTPGIYRVTCSYTLQPDPDTVHGGIEIVSQTFIINS